MDQSKFIIEYLYRDAANYKIYKKCEIPNPNTLTFSEFELLFRNKLIDHQVFDPNNIGLLKPQFSIYNPELEHGWCEFISLREEK